MINFFSRRLSLALAGIVLGGFLAIDALGQGKSWGEALFACSIGFGFVLLTARYIGFYSERKEAAPAETAEMIWLRKIWQGSSQPVESGCEQKAANQDRQGQSSLKFPS